MDNMQVSFIQFNRQLRNMQEWFYHYGKKLPKNEKAMFNSVKKINECLLMAGFEILNLVDCESSKPKEKKEAGNGTI